MHVRCNPLLREALQAELHRSFPEEEAGVHRGASHWFEEHDDLDEAVRHAVAGADLDRVSELIWRLAPTYAWDARRRLLRRWLSRVPVHHAERHAGVALSIAMNDLAAGSLVEARHWATFAAQQLGDVAPELRPSLEGGLAALEALGARDGIAPMRRDAARAATLMSEAHPARALCCLADGAGALLGGDRARATELLEDGALRGAIAAPGVAAMCEAELALAALCSGDLAEGVARAEHARSRAEGIGLEDHPPLALVTAVAAFARAHRGRFEHAQADVRTTRALLVHVDGFGPWYEAQVRLALARAELRLSDVATARGLIAEAGRLARRLADAPELRRWIANAAACADAAAAAGCGDASDPLTPAELRILSFLPSHLSFREMGDRLHVSSNTIKTHAHAIYRKLDASSRSAAVERAGVIGLLDDLAASMDLPPLRPT